MFTKINLQIEESTHSLLQDDGNESGQHKSITSSTINSTIDAHFRKSKCRTIQQQHLMMEHQQYQHQQQQQQQQQHKERQLRDDDHVGNQNDDDTHNTSSHSRHGEDHDETDEDDLVVAMRQALEEGEREAEEVAKEGEKYRAILLNRKLSLTILGGTIQLQSTSQEWQGAAIAGGVFGTMMGGPMLGLCAAVGGLTLAATSATKVGDVARTGGAAVAKLGKQFAQFAVHDEQTGKQQQEEYDC